MNYKFCFICADKAFGAVTCPQRLPHFNVEFADLDFIFFVV